MKNDFNLWAWLLAGIPCVLAWIAYGLVWLLTPRFPELGLPIDAALVVFQIYGCLILAVLFFVALVASRGFL